MWPRLRVDDVRAIVHYLGILVLVIGAMMLVPIVVALACREWNPALWFLLSLGITLSIGAAMLLVRPVRPGLTHRQAMIVTGLAWIVGGSVSALPLAFSGYFESYFDALFNSISYLTGTGMSLIRGLGKIPVSLSVWSSVMVIIGAQGIVLVAMGLGTISRFSGVGTLFQAEGHSDKIMPQMAGTSRFIAMFLGTFIAVGTLVCMAIMMFDVGLSPWNALYHGFSLATSAVATAGITIMPTSIAYYHSTMLNAVLSVLELTGIFSFALYFYMAKKGPREFFYDVETRTILVWSAVVTVVLALAFAQDPIFNEVGIFVDKGLFNLVSAATGTGFTTVMPSQLSSVATPAVLFTLIMGMLMGGATSSTAGGFKAIRLALLLKTILAEIRHTLMPDHAHEVIRFRHFGDQVLTSDLSRNVMLVILLYLLSFAFGAILGVAYGYDPISAVLESVSCTANCGFSSGIIAQGMPTGLKVCYFVQMLAGRLEFLTLLTAMASIVVSTGYAAKHSRAAKAVVSLVPADVRRAWRGQSAKEARHK